MENKEQMINKKRVTEEVLLLEKHFKDRGLNQAEIILILNTLMEFINTNITRDFMKKAHEEGIPYTTKK